MHAHDPSQYNVTWTTPSEGPRGSMPLGNGDVGVNVWVEPTGDLLLYLNKTDAWSENGRLLKLGRVRVTLSPNPLLAGEDFSQTLHLESGSIVVHGGEAKSVVRIRVWVDAYRPAVHIDVECDRPVTVTASLEVWRNAEREITEQRERHSAYGLSGRGTPIIVYPDTVVPESKLPVPDSVTWHHRNQSSMVRENMTLQGLGHLYQGVDDPLLLHTFGGCMHGDGLVRTTDTSIATASAVTTAALTIDVLARRTAVVDDWLGRLKSQAGLTASTPRENAWTAHAAHWQAFWQRSWIEVTGDDDAFTVSRGYALQRFILACSCRGEQPIKFNGSIFTTDPPPDEGDFDADYRRWGGPYWFQNTRLAYWPMLASGDFDGMAPLFRMFVDTMPVARERTRVAFDHDGLCYPETMHHWGTYAGDNFGWNRDGLPPGICENPYIRWYWTGALELVAILLDYHAYTGRWPVEPTDAAALIGGIIDFYDQHYPRDDQGKLTMQPSQALETWQDATNPLPDVAGLLYLLPKLMQVDDELFDGERAEQFQRLLDELPPIPVGRHTDIEHEGNVILPAERFAELKNIENPELYAVFPFRLFGVEREGIDLARRTFAIRRFVAHESWAQDGTQAACLGLADTAHEDAVRRFGAHDPHQRFPAFFGPNNDWTPDQCHGCSAMLTLQHMLMQTVDDQVLLLPAWTALWDVRFKLHGPGGIVVECHWHNGRMLECDITPSEQADRVTVLA